MFEADKLLPFATMAISLILTPGPAKLLLISTSAYRGFRAGFRLALGIFFSDTIHITLVSIGVGALIISNGNLRAIIAIVGASFLTYFAFVYARKAFDGPTTTALSKRPENNNDLVVIGLLLNLFNPLAIAFYVGLLPQFADPTSLLSAPLQLGIYGAALVSLFLTVHIILAFAAARFKSTNVSPTWFRVSYAVAAVVLLWLCFRILVGIFAAS